MKINFRLYLTLILYFFATFTLFPETVILKSGKSFYGSVIDQNREFLKLKEKNGNVLQFPRIDILKVTYKELDAKEVKKIIEVENKKIQPSPNSETELNETSLSDSIKQNQKIESIEKQSKLTSKKIRWGVVSRSTILPGWGQYHWDEPVWGSVYLVTFLGAVVNYHKAWNEHEKVKSEYQNDFRSLLLLGSGNAGFALNLIDKNNLATEYRSTANSLNTASDLIIGIFLINLIDSILYRADKNSTTITSLNKKPGLNLKAEVMNADQLHLYTKDQRTTSGSVEYKIGYTWAY